MLARLENASPKALGVLRGHGAVVQGDRCAQNDCYANYLWRTQPP